MIGADGGVLGFGDSYYYGSLPGLGVQVSNIVGMAPTPTTNQGTTNGLGYWMVGSDGGVFSFGDAKFHGLGAGCRRPCEEHRGHRPDARRRRLLDGRIRRRRLRLR